VGTDIYIYVEKRVNDAWLCASPKQKNPCFGDDDEPEYDLEGIEVGRNRALYQVLTGRGGKVYDDIQTAVPPRGLPVDVSAQVLAVAERSGDSGFTHSWLTLRELLDYSARGYTTKVGTYCPPQIAEQYRATGRLPDDFVPGDYDTPNGTWETVAERDEPLGDAIGLKDLIEQLSPVGEPEAVRIVFWLDG